MVLAPTRELAQQVSLVDLVHNLRLGKDFLIWRLMVSYTRHVEGKLILTFRKKPLFTPMGIFQISSTWIF